MEIQQLEYFKVIAECGSLTKAAQKLHTSQPSLSRSLRSLEDELGTPLFDRVGRNIVLNSAGRIALDRCMNVLNSTKAVKQDVERFVREKNLSVDVYSPVPMGPAGDILTGFKKKHPDIRVRMATFPSNYLKEYTPDITFFASPIVHKEPNYLFLGEEDIQLACAENSPYAKMSSVRLADLADERFVRILPSTLYDITSHMFIEAGFEPKTVMEIQEYSYVLAYVANGVGLTIAPAITWFGMYSKGVVSVPFSDVHRKRYLYLKWPENAIPNWATLRFRDYMVDYYNQHYGFNAHI